MNSPYSLRVLAVGLLLCVLAGCGDERPERTPFKGVVLIDGAPLAHGFIQVIPENSRPAYSPLDAEGRFELSTFDDAKDGAIAGTHKVIVNGMETISPVQVKWHAPKDYASVETSDLTITIPENADGTEPVTINLTWAGGKPFTEKVEAE